MYVLDSQSRCDRVPMKFVKGSRSALKEDACVNVLTSVLIAERIFRRKEGTWVWVKIKAPGDRGVCPCFLLPGFHVGYLFLTTTPGFSFVFVALGLSPKVFLGFRLNKDILDVSQTERDL